MNIDADKVKAIEVVMTQIEKQFGKGSIMRLGAAGWQPYRYGCK